MGADPNDTTRIYGAHRVTLATLCESNENPYVKLMIFQAQPPDERKDLTA